MREMRRKDRAIDQKAAMAILHKCEYGILSMLDSEGPYGLPLNFAVENDAIFFHSAPEGRKIDALKDDPRVSFCVVGNTEVMAEKFSTRYESVIVSGNAYLCEEVEKRHGLRLLLEKYSPDHIEAGMKYIDGSHRETAVYRIRIKSITGKARR